MIRIAARIVVVVMILSFLVLQAVAGTQQGAAPKHSVVAFQGVYTPGSPVLQAGLRPSPFIWKRVDRENLEGPILYQLLFNASGTPGTVPVFDSNPRHLANSPITVNGSMVAIGGLSINGSGVMTFAPGQNFPSSGLPPAGGDASGTLTNLTVIKLQNVAVSNTVPAMGQVLTFNGSSWTPATAPGSGTVTNVSNSDGFLSISSPTTTPVINFNLANTDARYAQVTALNSEVTRAQGAESTLQTNINSETSRAQSAEAAKANLAGGNSFTGDQTVTGNLNATNLNATGAITTQVPNGVSGTTNTRLAKLNGGNVVTAQTGDTAGVLGVVVSGGGTSGNALIAVGGQANCLFDNTNTTGDYVQIGTAGQCHDTGSTNFPSSGQVLGRVLTANVGAGTPSSIVLFGAEDASFPGGTVTQINTGAGLSGGPITSSGTIAIAANAVTNAMLQNPSLTVNPGTGLSGGGAVALGGSITLNNTGVLSVGASSPLSSSGGATPTISLTGIVGTGNGGTGLNASGAAGNYLRSNGTSWASSTIQVADLPSLSGTYVDLSTNQTIGGNKTFSNTIAGSISGNAATATNASQLGGVVAANYARQDASNTFAAANTYNASQNLAAGTAITTTIANDTVTGTIQNLLAKLNGSSPAQAIRAATTDVTGVVGVVISPTANTGNALIATIGQASCQFDGAATAGNYVVISSTVAGNCHDTGTNFPPNGGQVIGRVLSSIGGAGTTPVVLFGPEAAPPTSVVDNTGAVLAGSAKPMHTVAGTVNILGGGQATVTFASSVAFSATTSYRCIDSDTNGTNSTGVTRNSATQITVLGANGHNIDFICIGN